METLSIYMFIPCVHFCSSLSEKNPSRHSPKHMHVQARNQVSWKEGYILQGSMVARSLLGRKVWEIVLVDVHYYMQVCEYECIHSGTRLRHYACCSACVQ